MGASDNSAQREAQAAEAARQAQIAASVGQINSVFGSPSRQAQYQDYLGASRQLYNTDLNKQQALASRQLKFSLARSGNTGGSLATDQGRTLGEDYQRGVVNAERLAQGDLANLENQDQSSRLNLIGMAQAGLDSTTGANQAAESLRNNLASGASTRTVTGLGDVFSSLSGVYKNSQEQKQRRSDMEYLYNALYGNSGSTKPPGT